MILIHFVELNVCMASEGRRGGDPYTTTELARKRDDLGDAVRSSDGHVFLI
jgi:hypothetical protein